MLVFLGYLQHFIEQKQKQNSSELPPGINKNEKQGCPSLIRMLPIRKKCIFRWIDHENKVVLMANTLMENVPEFSLDQYCSLLVILNDCWSQHTNSE